MVELRNAALVERAGLKDVPPLVPCVWVTEAESQAWQMESESTTCFQSHIPSRR